MRATEFIVEADSYSPPTLNVGDRILKGKFKNSPAEITGFTQDKHNQPVLKTNRGEVQLFKPRVTKLMDKDVAEGYEESIPSILYHATYKPRLKSIGLKGLGAGGKRNWEDSQRGVVYLALDPYVAESYAETSDMVPDEWLDQIVILKISTAGLDPNKFGIDSNVQDNAGDTVEYHGVIPLKNISLYKQGVTEASYPGNIGMMEVAKFFNMATPKEKIIFKRLMNMGEKNKAWQLIQKVTGVKLRGKEFDLVAEGLSIDVPNEQWLQDKIDYAKSKGRDQWGAPFFGTTTAYARPDPQVSVVRLELLKGMRNEQDNVRAKDLEWLMAHMEKTGKLPLTKRGEEYAPYVMVAYNGEAWVNDGNHRIMAAYRLGWKTLPVQLAYFDGGERVESGIMYPKKIGL